MSIREKNESTIHPEIHEKNLRVLKDVFGKEKAVRIALLAAALKKFDEAGTENNIMVS